MPDETPPASPPPPSPPLTDEEVLAHAQAALLEMANTPPRLLPPGLPSQAPRGPAVRFILELDGSAAATAVGLAGLGVAAASGMDLGALLTPIFEGVAAGIGGEQQKGYGAFAGSLAEMMKRGAKAAGGGCGRCAEPPAAVDPGGLKGHVINIMAMARSCALLLVASRTDTARAAGVIALLNLAEGASRLVLGAEIRGRCESILVALHSNSSDAPALLDSLLAWLIGSGAQPGKGDEIQASWNKFGGKTPPPEEGDPVRGVMQPTFYARMRGPFVQVHRVTLQADPAAGLDRLTVAYSEVGFPLEETMILPRGAGQGMAAALGLEIGEFYEVPVEPAKA